jgi:hypothetical protein
MGNTVNKQANIAFKIDGADAARQDVEKIRTAIEGLGTDGAKIAQPIVDAFNNIQTADDRLTRKISDGRVVTQRDGAVMLQQFELLKDAINSAFGSIANAPQAVQQAYATAEQQFARTTDKIQKATDAVQDQKGVLQEGGVRWTSFSDGLNQVIGKFGGVQVALAGVFAALTEGWQLGTQAAQAMGADVDLTKSAVDGLKSAYGQLFASIPKADFLSQVAFSWRNLGNILNDNATSVTNLKTAMDAGIPRVDALKMSTDDLARVAGIWQLAVNAGADGLRLFNATVAATKPQDLVDALESLKGKFESLAIAANKANVEEARRKTIIAETIKTIDDEITALERERIARQIGVDKLQEEIRERANYKTALEKSIQAGEAATRVSGGLTDQLKEELDMIRNNLGPAYQTHKTLVEAFSDALGKDVEKYKDGLSPAQQQHLREIADLASKYPTLTDAQRSHLNALLDEQRGIEAATTAAQGQKVHFDALTGTITNVSAKSDDLKISQDALGTKIANTADVAETNAVKWDPITRSVTNAGTAAHLGGGGFTDFGDSINTAGTSLDELKGKLEANNTELERFARNLENATKKVRDLGTASAATAGGDGGSAPAPSNDGNPYLNTSEAP